MGLLDRIQESERRLSHESQQRLLAQQQEAQRTAATASQTAEQARIQLHQTSSRFLRDTKLIIALVGKLPQVDYSGYLEKISDYTGFKHEVGIYTAPKPDLSVEDPIAETVARAIAQRDEALITSNLVRVDRNGPVTHSPEIPFFGDGRQRYNTYAGFLGWRINRHTLSEPKEPGVGIHLWKVEREEERGRDRCECRNCGGKGELKPGIQYTDTTSCAYARVTPDNKLVVTWNRDQKVADFSDFSVLDELMSKAVDDPVVNVRRKFIADTILRGGGGYQGDAADLDY
jgi:hypothetical protein